MFPYRLLTIWACVGLLLNTVLPARTLSHDQCEDTVVEVFTQVDECCGVVCPSEEKDAYPENEQHHHHHEHHCVAHTVSILFVFQSKQLSLLSVSGDYLKIAVDDEFSSQRMSYVVKRPPRV